MADASNKSTAVYRSEDPLSNLRIRVKLWKASSATTVPQVIGKSERRQRQDFEEHVFHWQQKVFSRNELITYQDEENCTTPLTKKYHKEIEDLMREKVSLPKQRLFTYTESDIPLVSDDLSSDNVLSSPDTYRTFLVDRVEATQRRLHHRQGIPKTNIVDTEPTAEVSKYRQSVSSTHQTMLIMADLSPSNVMNDDTGKHQSEPSDLKLLCCVKAGRGVLLIRPDFSSTVVNSKESRMTDVYKVQRDEGRDVFEYTLEHCSSSPSIDDLMHEAKLANDLYVRRSTTMLGQVGHDVSLPPSDCVDMVLVGEIQTAQDFHHDGLFVHYMVDLPHGWSMLSRSEPGGVSSVCSSDSSGVCHLAHPVELHLRFTQRPTGARFTPVKWPSLLLHVMSCDWWERVRTEGYGYCTLPTSPGVRQVTVTTWTPSPRSVGELLSTHFLGGAAPLEDWRYVSTPSLHDDNVLGKLGFRTETTGSVTLRLNTVFQSRDFLSRTGQGRTRKFGNPLLNLIGGSAMQMSITHVIDAFHRARSRMLSVREG